MTPDCGLSAWTHSIQLVEKIFNQVAMTRFLLPENSWYAWRRVVLWQQGGDLSRVSWSVVILLRWCIIGSQSVFYSYDL